MNNEIKEILKCMKNYGSTTELALLDYITNLQETIDFQDKWLEYYKDFISENNIEDYKSRIEKANEYIDVYLKNVDDIDINIVVVKDILNGRSDE